MSVIVTLIFPADGKQVEELAKATGTFAEVSESGKEHGAMAHRFYASDGKVMVIDEWPDAESFQTFFQANDAKIGPIMAEVAQGEPEITFWHKLDTGDEFGWGA